MGLAAPLLLFASIQKALRSLAATPIIGRSLRLFMLAAATL
jgi:hypothetical protein